MSKCIRLAVVFALLLGTAGCGKTEETPAVRKSPVEAPTETATSRPASPVVSVEPQSITYRPVKARLRLSDEQVVIMVPDTMDIESGRMLEYREGDNGKYYLKSVIPN